MDTFGMFVKQPQAGRVKTRLAADWDDERAASLYECFIHDLADRFRSCGDRRVLCFAPNTDDSIAYFQKIAVDDYHLWPQPEESLGKRMLSFMQHALTNPDDRVVIVGSDSPTLPLAHVDAAFEALETSDCVIGPATDGGYYLIGQRNPVRDVFDDVDWSTSKVLQQTIERVQALGLSLSLLSPWYDIDSRDDVAMMEGHVRAAKLAASNAKWIPIRAIRHLLGDTTD